MQGIAFNMPYQYLHHLQWNPTPHIHYFMSDTQDNNDSSYMEGIKVNLSPLPRLMSPQ